MYEKQNVTISFHILFGQHVYKRPAILVIMHFALKLSFHLSAIPLP